MTVKIVHAVSDGFIEGNIIRRGEPWYADDPVVKQFPSYFTDDPRQVMRATAPIPESDQIWEQATAAPGERRGQVKRG